MSDYQPRLVVRDGRYFFLLKELGLMGAGDSVEAAYADLAAKRARVEADFQAAGLAGELPPAMADRPADPHLVALKWFAAKAAIVAVTVAVVLFFGQVALNAYSQRIARLGKDVATNVSGPLIVESIQKELQRNVDKLGPERQQVMADNARILVERLRPVVRELKPLFADEGPQKGCPR